MGFRPARLCCSTDSRTARSACRASPCRWCRRRSSPAIGVRFTGARASRWSAEANAGSQVADAPAPTRRGQGPGPDGRRVRRHPRHLHAAAPHRSRPRRAGGGRRAPRPRRRGRSSGSSPRGAPPQRGGGAPLGRRPTSPTARTSSSPSPARMSGAWSAAARPRSNRLHAATTPEPAAPVVDLGVDQINRRFAAACAAARLEGRRTSHGGRERGAHEPPTRIRCWDRSDRLPQWTKPVSEITSADLLHILAPIWHAEPETARRVCQRIGASMKWAVADVEHRDGADHGGGQRRPRQGVDGIGRGERRGRRDWRRRRRRRGRSRTTKRRRAPSETVTLTVSATACLARGAGRLRAERRRRSRPFDAPAKELTVSAVVTSGPTGPRGADCRRR